MKRLFIPPCLSVLLAAGCDDTAQEDGGIDASTRVRCTNDDECDDGVFCNGSEVCSTDAPADSDGGMATPAPCDATLFCDEEMDACVEDDCEDPDLDRDPARLAVGGDSAGGNTTGFRAAERTATTQTHAVTARGRRSAQAKGPRSTRTATRRRWRATAKPTTTTMVSSTRDAATPAPTARSTAAATATTRGPT